MHTFWSKVSKCALSAHILELCGKMCTKCKWIFENFWNFGYILAIFGHILAKIWVSAHILDFFGEKGKNVHSVHIVHSARIYLGGVQNVHSFSPPPVLTAFFFV